MYTKLQKHGLSWGSSTFIGAWHQVLLMHSAIVSTVVFTIYFKFRLLSHLQFCSLSLQGGGGKEYRNDQLLPFGPGVSHIHAEL